VNNTEQHNIEQHNSEQHNIEQHNSEPHNIEQHNIEEYIGSCGIIYLYIIKQQDKYYGEQE